MEESKQVEIPIHPNLDLTSHLISESENLRCFVDSTIYRQVITSLIYLITCTKPDICSAVSVFSGFMQQPRELHFLFLKNLHSYVKTTIIEL